MGVRFPTQQQPPDFGQMQQVRDPQQNAAQQEEVQAPVGAGAREPRRAAQEEAAVREAQQPQALAQQTQVERAANDAGAQTPGSIIDILA